MINTNFKKKVPVLIAGLIIISFALLPAACKKGNIYEPQNSYPSDVLDKWMLLQVRLMKNATGIPNQAFSRHYVYAGIAALESLSPGLSANNKKWSSKWNGLSGVPVAGKAKDYYLPAVVNATLASINRQMFPTANASDKAAIDSLENSLNQDFQGKESASIINNSENFGKSVATAVYNWAETDGYKNASNPYTLPTGEGKWKPFPSTATPSTPYWGNNRPVMAGSISNTNVPGPPAYSTDHSSDFYKMVKQLYDASLTLTDDQKAMALHWRDVPGVTSPGHWVSIVQQIIKQRKLKLEEAVVVYALTGVALNDALIRSFQIKYQQLTVRPITYIREVMGYGNWASFIGTPPHPEYISNHAVLSMAPALVLEKLLGSTPSFTDHTFEYMGMAPRTYTSYKAIGLEAGISRFYAGIHYMPSIEHGFQVANKIAENIFQSNKNK